MKYICPGQKFCPWLETSFPKAKMIFKPWTKFFVEDKNNFVQDKNNFVQDKSDFVLDKKYFVRADGQGIHCYLDLHVCPFL